VVDSFVSLRPDSWIPGGGLLLHHASAPFEPRGGMEVQAVFLVGFMASGKSSVGRELARRLGWDFVDLDARIEERERQTVPEIFRERGEVPFRLAETAALNHLLMESLQQDSVVALGGGAFIQEANRKLLQAWPTVFLEAPASELWQRSLTDGIERPLRGDPEHFATLYAERLPYYRQAKVTIVTSGKDLGSICGEIKSSLQSWNGETAGSRPIPSTHPQSGEPQ
jgi:shikimate kinase